jgi:hypothetical protein
MVWKGAGILPRGDSGKNATKRSIFGTAEGLKPLWTR